MLPPNVLHAMLAFIFFLGFAGNACSTAPTYKALIVGVSDYPGLDKSLWLDGPRNDALRMRAVLLARGVPATNITVLADGVPDAELPTRQRILGAFDALARTAQPNDYIVIQMSGHGSQQPVPIGSPHAADEPDGLFEIFLPRDAEGWDDDGDPQDGGVKNAIVDYEIRQAVDRMTAAGAFVWGIFDSCHSATLVRSAGNPEVKLRQVLPSDLRIPPDAITKSLARAALPAGQTATAAAARPATPPSSKNPAPARGGSVFFYAAQTHEPTPEMKLPLEAPDRLSHGLFTFSIMQALETGASMSYQQLAQQILIRYAGIGEARATPLFTGTALTSGVLGQEASMTRQWPLTATASLAIAAGSLADIHDGAVFVILPTALSNMTEALGYAKVVHATATTATLAPTAHATLKEQPLSVLRAGSIARMVEPGINFDFAVATDLSACAQPCPFSQPLEQVKKGVNEKVSTGHAIKWTQAGHGANVTLKAIDRRLWVLPPSLAGSQPCPTEVGKTLTTCRTQMEKSMVYIEASPTASGQGLTEEIDLMLKQVRRSGNLMRVAASLATAPAASKLDVQLKRVTPDGRQMPIEHANISHLRPGERVQVELTNIGKTTLDVTALYLDSKFGIDIMYPAPGASNRIEPGSAPVPIEIGITDTTLGLERLAVIAAEVTQHAERTDYSFLAQPSVSSTVVTRQAMAAGTLLRDAGFGDFATRGGEPSAPPSATGMQIFSWQISQDAQ